MFADTLLIVFISVCTALLAEGEGAASLTSELSPRGGSQARGPRRHTGQVVSPPARRLGREGSCARVVRVLWSLECLRRRPVITVQVQLVESPSF